MKVNGIQSQIFTPKITGYAAAVGMGVTLLSAVSKNKTFKKSHKSVSWLTALLTVLHIGLIEYYHYKYKDK